MEEVERASVRTNIRLGAIAYPAAMFKTHGDPPGKINFETAGPNGRPLRTQDVAEAAPADEVPKDDPLGVTPDPAPRSEPGRYRRVLVEEGTDVEVPRDQVRKGIRRDNGDFVDLTGYLEEIEDEAKLEEIEIIGFIDRRNVPRDRILGSYYVAVGGDSDGLAFGRVLHETLGQASRVAVLRWTKRKGQTVGVLAPHPSGALVALELAWYAQMRAPNQECLAHLRADVTQGEIDATRELIDAMAARRDDLDDLRDSRWSAIEALVARADAGELDAYELKPEPVPAEMESLEDLLRASLAGTGAAR